jgi:hypothetical protein
MRLESPRPPRGPRCPGDETLHDLADGLLDAREADLVRAHAAECAHCAGFLARVERLRERAAALPREVEPPAPMWDAVRTKLAPRGGRPVRTLTFEATRSRRAWRRPALLAAAAVGLMALSSAGTALVMRRAMQRATPSDPAVAVAPRPAVATPSRALPIPASLHSVDAGHQAAVAELERALAERQNQLAPETVAAIERSLGVVDAALAEARTALARDPGNTDLADLVAVAYEQKIGVLRRATELTVRS